MKNFISSIQSFFRLEQAGGIVLIFAASIAMIVANSPLYEHYSHLIHSPFKFELLGISINKDFHFFVNDGLLVVFFLLIALELKRELVKGELKEPKNIILPAVAAVMGVMLPSGIYYFFNQGLPTEQGWAIPAATDIAIAFGVLLLAGDRVPSSLKIFLLSLAIIDDMLVIGIITMFFTESLNYTYLSLAVFFTLVLMAMNYKKVENFAPFAVVGFILWYVTYMSGIHATIAGVVLGLCIPMTPRSRCNNNGEPVEERKSMLESLEHSLHETVSFAILPLFAFLNAGVKIKPEDLDALTSPVSLGIVLGLIVGKQVAVFASTFILVKLKVVDMPRKANWLQIYGVAALCGVGFTMGLFIGGLSFVGMDVQYKLPILIGSVLSGLAGLLAFKLSFYLEDQEKQRWREFRLG
ncbi:Na+/H+ antiporter NhaA [Vibrio owensii]|uniref:Na+/H+ antiporter NhaA n=1 Tax=Vibrio harveyi group TaxID=717610 RepID=UPI003CC5E4A9